jgi:hypothetical protein
MKTNLREEIYTPPRVEYEQGAGVYLLHILLWIIHNIMPSPAWLVYEI